MKSFKQNSQEIRKIYNLLDEKTQSELLRVITNEKLVEVYKTLPNLLTRTSIEFYTHVDTLNNFKASKRQALLKEYLNGGKISGNETRILPIIMFEAINIIVIEYSVRFNIVTDTYPELFI